MTLLKVDGSLRNFVHIWKEVCSTWMSSFIAIRIREECVIKTGLTQPTEGKRRE